MNRELTSCSVRIRDLSVDLPIYHLVHKSLKRQFVRVSTGGRFGQANERAVVRALKNINLEIGAGERLGIIGPNGAGKTTLLRAISGIYEPTRGVVEVQGEIIALTDICLGMDDFATGFENITLRGRMMGMSNTAIRARAEEIAEFAELGEFLDMPVRTYSSGMKVRLAFAISTAVDAEVLVLDEWLGAGDRFFQEKARQRMAQVVERSGIVVFAGHSDEAMKTFCTRAVLLNEGELVMDGTIDEAIAAYERLR